MAPDIFMAPNCFLTDWAVWFLLQWAYHPRKVRSESRVRTVFVAAEEVVLDGQKSTERWESENRQQREMHKHKEV